jgi:cytoskeletal protein CcmA (bactofilin family)
MVSIPASVHIVGDVRSDEDLAIAGVVRGNIQVRDGMVMIAEHAKVDGEVRGRRVHIRGSVTGTTMASELIEIAASASVTGHISADHVLVSDGAIVNGHIDMNRRTIAARVARHRSASAPDPVTLNKASCL